MRILEFRTDPAKCDVTQYRKYRIPGKMNQFTYPITTLKIRKTYHPLADTRSDRYRMTH